MKRALAFTYALIVATMAAATWIEHLRGTDFVAEHIYGAWWFSLLWAMLAALGVAWIVRQRMRRWSTLLLHAAFVVILCGALLTHLTASRGIMHLRLGESTDRYSTQLPGGATEARHLPFHITLDSFRIDYHAGTTAERDYTSHFTLRDGRARIPGQVAMNRIFTYRAVRLYQSAYDPYLSGSYLAVNTDPYGIPVTYTGYALLFIAFLGMLLDPHATFRRLLADARLRRGAFLLLALTAIAGHAAEPLIVPRATADRFGRLHLLYNDRIAPVQTFAIDFTKKLYGRTTYHGLTAEQVLLSRLFDPRGWDAEPMIRVKDASLRRHLGLPRYAAVNDFFAPGRGYILGPYLMEYEQGQRDAFHRACADMDAKLRLIMSLRDGSALALFPHATPPDGSIRWRHTAAPLTPDELPRMDALFLRSYLALLREPILAADYPAADRLIDKLDKYQHLHAVGTLPSPIADRAERLTNAIPFATLLFILNLTVGLLAMLYTLRRLTRQRDTPRTDRLVYRITFALLTLSFVLLTLCEVLRWIVAGRTPLANGYETMLLIAWFIHPFALLASRRFPIALPFGALLSGFFLLVSHLALMDPRITPIMPILSSPLLSLHVSVIMMAYALLSLTFICALTALILLALGRRDPQRAAEQADALRLLSLLFLYPALATLGIGIFVGAIWANVSWGTYWSWDPKETWALITFMVYAVVVHTHTFPRFRRPVAYHLYLLLSFLTLLMTYFGVNYLLGGMHSYA